MPAIAGWRWGQDGAKPARRDTAADNV